MVNVLEDLFKVLQFLVSLKDNRISLRFERLGKNVFFPYKARLGQVDHNHENKGDCSLQEGVERVLGFGGPKARKVKCRREMRKQ